MGNGKEERAERLLKLDKELGSLDRYKRDTIAQIVIYSLLLAISVALFVLAILDDIIYFKVICPFIVSLCIYVIIMASIQLKKVKKQIESVCKEVADLVNEDLKEIFEKIIKDIDEQLKALDNKKMAELEKVTPKKRTPKKTDKEK
jgi:hypothetical protein